MPRAGLEPTRAYAHGPLKTACLPIPPPRPVGVGDIITYDSERQQELAEAAQRALSDIIGKQPTAMLPPVPSDAHHESTQTKPNEASPTNDF